LAAHAVIALVRFVVTAQTLALALTGGAQGIIEVTLAARFAVSVIGPARYAATFFRIGAAIPLSRSLIVAPAQM
jgi:hypothetical protein